MNQATADFIRTHAAKDVRQLAFLASRYPEVDMPWALSQIAGRQTARTKLPTWAATEGIVYPPPLSMEQCSSEQTALYKAEVGGGGRRFADLTGGFGVDFSFLSRGFAESVYVEQQATLCEIARRNFRLLGVEAEVVCGDGIDYLRHADDDSFDLLFLDPARRDRHGGRTFAISDCTPDVTSAGPLLLRKSRRVLLKLSPMLDWRKAVDDLGRESVREVHIVSAGNECKELLLLLGRGEGLRLVCVNGTERFEPCTLQGGDAPGEAPPADSLPGMCLYEPNASVMKSGCFSEVARQYGVSQVGPNSHLFVSAEPVAAFPGRKFRIEQVASMNKRELKQKLGGLSQANITVRNFPASVAELRKRLKISEGGSTYIFATPLARQTHALLILTRLP